MSLTDLQIQKMKRRENRYEVPDGNGLFLRVSQTGHKSWIYRYRFGKEKIPRRMTLGAYPVMTLAKARVMHAQGAGVIDIGAESTTARARRVGAEQQVAAVMPVIEALAADGIPTSVEGYDLEVVWDVLTVAALGVPFAKAQYRDVATLSGGEKMRFAFV